jgi:hypothetical protein
MKKDLLLFLLTVVSFALFTVSCDDKQQPASYIDIEYDASQQVSEKGGTATFNVISNVSWNITNSDAWITAIAPAQGSGNQTVSVTFEANNAVSVRTSRFTINVDGLYGEALIIQAAGKFPAAAGTISGDNEGFESITLTIGVIENADTYKWYRNGAEIQHSAERTCTVTENGLYTVAGVNAVGEGQPSPGKRVTVTDYLDYDALPVGTFLATGAPKANAGGYSSWSGTVSKHTTDGGKQLYVISNWGSPTFNSGYPLKYQDGRLFVDNEILITYNETTGTRYEGYFNACYMTAIGEVVMIENFSPKYSMNESKISFLGTYDGYPVLVGVLAFLVNGQYSGYLFTEMYENASVIVTPSASGASVAQQSTSKVTVNNLRYGGKVQFDPAKFIAK